MGYISVDEMLHNLTCEEYDDLETYYTTFPFDADRMEYGVGVITAMLAYGLGMRKTDKTALTPADFIPNYIDKVDVKKDTEQTIHRNLQLVKRMLTPRGRKKE